MAQPPLTDHRPPEPAPLARERLETAASQGEGIYILAEEELLQLDGPKPTESQSSERPLASTHHGRRTRTRQRDGRLTPTT